MTAFVYRFWGYNGEPIYVGQTENLKERIASHGSHRARNCDRLDICKCENRAEALRVEKSEIRRLRPLENVEHNPDFGYPSAPLIEHSKQFLDVPKGVGCFNLAAMDKSEPPWRRSYLNWRNRGFDGFQIDKPLDEVEIEDANDKT